jgi:hypothetical protein
MGYTASTSDSLRPGFLPRFVASNLGSTDPLRGFLSFDGPNPEGEYKSYRVQPFRLESTTVEAPGTTQRPGSEVRVSFEQVWKMKVQLLPHELKTALPIFQAEVGRSLSAEIRRLNTLSALTAFTASAQILTTKYTTTMTPNLIAKTAEADGVYIMKANADPNPDNVKPEDYGLTPKRLMNAITRAQAVDARYTEVSGAPMGMSEGTPVFGVGRPYVLLNVEDTNDLMMWQVGSETTTGKQVPYANTVPGLMNAFFGGMSPMDRGRRDLDGNVRMPLRMLPFYRGFALIECPPAKDGPYGGESLLYHAPGVQKINLTGTTGTGKIDIIYRIVIAHSEHVSRWINFRTQPMINLSVEPGNSSVQYYDASLTAGAHRNDGYGIVMLEVRRPYNYDPYTGAIITPTLQTTGLPGAPSTFHKSGNTSMAETMAMGTKSSGITYSVDSTKIKVQKGRSEPEVIDLNNEPPLQEIANETGTGTVLVSGRIRH